MLPSDEELMTDEELDALLDESGDLAGDLEESEMNDDGVELDEDGAEIAIETAPGLTYEIDFETGEISGKIDAEKSLKQFITKSLFTPRDEHEVYTSDFGSEIEELLAEQEGADYVEVELERICREAIESDDRILEVESVETSFADDRVYVTIVCATVYGAITEEVEI